MIPSHLPPGARCAIYYAPLEHPALWSFGSATIGSDAVTGAASSPRPPAAAFAEGWADDTAEPRRYGFHATLKAPFALAPGARYFDLLEAAAAFAAEPRELPMLRLGVRVLDGFVALMPAAQPPALDALAADCVRAFDRFRAPMSPADRERRAPEHLTPRQRGHLDAWGYPFVFEDYRFHLTLTGRLPPERAEPVRAALAQAFEAACGDREIAVATLAVFVQEEPKAHFRLAALWPLATICAAS